MGTTSDKLIYLNTTKTKIKDAINLANTNITNETFRAYEGKIKQALINTMNDKWGVWNNFEKVTGTGTSLTLNNTAQAPLKLDLKGDTSQYTTTGKNKADFKTISYSSASSATVTRDGEEYTVVNSTSRWGGCRFSQSNLQLETNTTYTFSALVKSTNSTDGAYLYVYGGINNTGSNISGPKAKNGERCYVTFTTPVEFLGGTQQIALLPGEVEKSAVFTNIMIEKSSTMTDYEPYTNGPAPNPDFPMDIHVVSGDNTIKVCGKNLLPDGIESQEINGLTITKGADKSITINGTTNATTRLYFTLDLLLKSGNYIVSMNKEGTASGTCFISMSDGVTEFFSFNPSNASYKALNLTEDKIAKISFYSSSSRTFTNFKIYPMLEKGNQATTYTPYVSQNQLISLGLYNYFDKNHINKLNGSVGNEYMWPSENAKTLYIKCKPNTTYTITKISSTRFRVGTTTNQPTTSSSINKYVNTSDTGTSETITTGANDNYLLVYYYLSGTDTLTEQQIIDSIRIYIPSETPIELNKIGNHQDYIYKTDKWYLHKEIGKVVLDGSEDIRYSSSSYFFLNESATSMNGVVDAPLLCNYYYSPFQGSYGIRTGTNYYIQFRNLDYSNADDFKTWLSTHNTIVYYVLATPTNTEITDNLLINQLNKIEQFMSYESQTNISQENNDLPFIISASALKEV